MLDDGEASRRCLCIEDCAGGHGVTKTNDGTGTSADGSEVVWAHKSIVCLRAAGGNGF